MLPIDNKMTRERKMYSNNCMTNDQRKAIKHIDFIATLKIESVIAWMQGEGHLQPYHIEKIEVEFFLEIILGENRFPWKMFFLWLFFF